MLQHYNILNVRISAVNLDSAALAINGMIRRRERGYVCIAPVSTIVDCHRNPEYRQIVNHADLVTPDGMPVVWLGQSQGFTEVQRTYGPDLMEKLCAEGRTANCRHFFYGGTEAVCDRLEQRLKERFPGLIVAGKYSPPYTAQAELAPRDVIEMINAARPDILWVGLGAPKQDFWSAMHRPLLNVPVIIGIGAAFDFLAGVKRQAPRWMQRSGLEWLFRLGCEPGRLWKRYLIGNTLFLWLLLKQALTGKTHDQ